MSWYVRNADDLVLNPERSRQSHRLPVGAPNYDSWEHWTRLLARKGDSLQRALGHHVGKILGCGRYGCTATSDSGAVLKLTPLPQRDWQSDEELKFWTKMKSEQRRRNSLASKSVVKVYDAWVITDKDTGEVYLAVLRDEVEPLADIIPDPLSAGHSLVETPPATKRRIGDELPEAAFRIEDLQFWLDNARLDSALEPVKEAVQEYQLGDVHIGNLGWKGNRLVIFDADYAGDAPVADKQLRVNRERQERDPELPAYGPTFEEWSELLERKGDDLEHALGMRVGDIIGCGAFGCVVESVPGRVIKLTSERQHHGDLGAELAFWTRMKKEQERPRSPASQGVAHIDRIASITDKDTGEKYIAVLREDVVPVMNTETWRPAAETTRRGVALDDIFSAPEARGAVEAMQEYGLDDVHPGNLGWSGDRIVIFDAHMRGAPLKEHEQMRVNKGTPYGLQPGDPVEIAKPVIPPAGRLATGERHWVGGYEFLGMSRNIEGALRIGAVGGDEEDRFVIGARDVRPARMARNDSYSPFHEQIPGGLAAGMRPEDFDPEQLRMGIEIEMEHTPDPVVATEIAMDHLVEDHEYYTKLKSLRLNPSRDPFDMDFKSVAEELEERRKQKEEGNWYPASGGSEKPFRTRTGKRLQYVWQPSTGRHAYYDLDTDMILSDEEALSPAYGLTANGRRTRPSCERCGGRIDVSGHCVREHEHRAFERGLRDLGKGVRRDQQETSESERAAYLEGWHYEPNARAFYVFEMDGDEPLRMANKKPLTKKQAQQFARIGAQNGKHDRVVTTDPRKDDFRVVERYEAGR